MKSVCKIFNFLLVMLLCISLLTACGETPAPNGSDSITDSSQAVSNQSQTGAKPNSNTSGGNSAYATAYHNYNPIYHNKGMGDEDTIRNIFIYCR